MNVTITTHNGSKAHREHNVRNPKVISKEKHIDPNGKFEIWKDEKVQNAYHRIFDRYVDEYNFGKREDRKIKDYYTKIKNDKKKHTCYEMIIGVYTEFDKYKNLNPTEKEKFDEINKKILKEFVDTWEERNPNLEMIGAYYHADEEGQPHCHIDYIPIATGYKNGLKVQNGLVKAYECQGIKKKGKETAQIQWEKRENKYLESLCEEKGYTVKHPTEAHREHLSVEEYKSTQNYENSLKRQNRALEEEKKIREELKATQDKAIKDAQDMMSKMAFVRPKTKEERKKIQFYIDQVEDIEKREKELETKNQELKDKENKLKAKESELKGLENDIKTIDYLKTTIYNYEQEMKRYEEYELLKGFTEEYAEEYKKYVENVETEKMMSIDRW